MDNIQNPQQNGIANAPTDPSIQALMKSIGLTETKGDYNATGDGGNSLGAYQISKQNWSSWGQQYLGDANAPLTPANQDKITYNRIKDLASQGYKQSNIASIWNSGKPDPTGNIGINAQGEKYDTPQYVKSVGDTYNQIMQGNTNPTPTPTSSTVGANNANNSTSNQPPENNWQKAGDVLGAVGNFAFPIVKDLYNDIQGKDDKTILQQAGDAGLSALWFLPFGDIAEGAGAGLEALGAGEKLAQGAGVIATGAGIGYAGDVSVNLAQGKTDTSVVKPGLGTLMGGGLAGAGLAVGNLYNKFFGEQAVVNKVQQAYADAEGATKSAIKAGSKTIAKGLTANPEFLANAGISPETEEVNGRIIFKTGPDSASQQTLQDRATALTNLRDQVATKSGAKFNFEDLRTGMLSQAEQEFSGTALDQVKNHINTEMNAYAQDPKFNIDQNGDISVGDASAIKTDLQGKTKYDATRPSQISQANGMMAKITKGVIDDEVEKAGVPGINEINKIIQQHLDAKDFLNRINGQTVKGGRIGKYLYEGVGAVAGEGVSKVLGNNIIGNALAPVAGAYVGGKVSEFMQRLAVGGATSAATLGRMATEDPEVVQQFLQYLGENGEKVAPMVQPIQKTAGATAIKLLKGLPGIITGSKRLQYPKSVFNP